MTTVQIVGGIIIAGFMFAMLLVVCSGINRDKDIDRRADKRGQEWMR